MGEEMMMVVEDVMRSIDMKMLGDLLNGLTAVFEGDLSFDELLGEIMGGMMGGDMSGITSAVDKILEMLEIDESGIVLASGFLDVAGMILMDVNGFLEAVNNSPDGVAKRITGAFAEWFKMNGIEEEEAFEIVVGSPLFSFDTATFNAILASENPTDLYAAIAMVSENVFETLSYIENKFIASGFLEGALLPMEMWSAIKGHIDDVANGILWCFLNLPEDLVVGGIIEVLVAENNKILDFYFGFKPKHLALMIAYMRRGIYEGYQIATRFILPRVVSAIDIAMDGRDTLSGLLNIAIDQINFLGEMTNFTIEFDKIDMMFAEAPGIKAWIDVVRYGFFERLDDEYFTIENDTEFPGGDPGFLGNDDSSFDSSIGGFF